MHQKKWNVYAFWILLTEAVGALSGWLTREGAARYSEALNKPLLSPPAVVFPIVWGLLFALMGISAARIYLASGRTITNPLLLYFVQLTVNFLWSILFFTFRSYGFAFFWLIALWGLILAMILWFRSIDRAAAWLQLPYLLWVAFAGYLNFGVWMLNR